MTVSFRPARHLPQENSPPWLTALIGALAGVVVLGWLSQWVEGRIGGLASLWLRGLVLPLGGTGVGMMVLGWGAWRDLPSRLELVRTPDDSRWIATHACLAGAGAFLVAIPLVWLSRVAFGGWLPEQPPPVLTDLLAAGAGRGVWVAVFVQALLLAPLAEELLFRLFLVESLRAQRIPHPALPMALVFALVHARLDQAAGLCVLALWLYRLRCRYGSLLPAILAHAVFNALALAGACWALLGNS